MSSASSVQADATYADFPPIEDVRAGFWYVGLAAAATWALAAVVIQVLPDIDDFERTDLLAQIAGGIAVLLLIGHAGGAGVPLHAAGEAARVRPLAGADLPGADRMGTGDREIS